MVAKGESPAPSSLPKKMGGVQRAWKEGEEEKVRLLLFFFSLFPPGDIFGLCVAKKREEGEGEKVRIGCSTTDEGEGRERRAPNTAWRWRMPQEGDPPTTLAAAAAEGDEVRPFAGPLFPSEGGSLFFFFFSRCKAALWAERWSVAEDGGQRLLSQHRWPPRPPRPPARILPLPLPTPKGSPFQGRRRRSPLLFPAAALPPLMRPPPPPSPKQKSPK